MNMIKASVKETPSKDGTPPKRRTIYEPITWTSVEETAFQSIKDAFRDGVILQHFDPSKQIFIYTDASGWASGGVMKQRNTHGDLQPIAFFSKKHSPAECNYDIYDLELMAIIRAFEEWEPEIMGSSLPTQVITDHKNLELFMATKKLSRRQARWSLFLSQFDFKIAYAPGELNGEADALSRREQDIPTDASDPRHGTVAALLGPKVLSPGMKPAIDTALRALTIGPEHCTPEQQAVVQLLVTHTEPLLETVDPGSAEAPPNDGTVDPALPPFDHDTRSTDEMLDQAYSQDPMALKAFEALDSGATQLSKWFHKSGYYFNISDLSATGSGTSRRLWIDKSRLYIPPDARLRRRIFALCHDHEIAGHKGPRSTFYLMYDHYYWPKMHQSIKTYCDACGVCHRTKSPRDGKHGYLRPLPIPHARWSDLSVDFIQDLPPSKSDGRVYNNILVICDRLTKRRHFFPTHGRTSLETARCFMEVFKLHGLPLSIVSDRGTNFVSALWQRICHRLHIQRQLSTAWHPETDGQTERANQSLEVFLRQYVNFAQDDWASWLHVAEFQANDTVNSSTGMTPFFADLGYHPRSGIHLGDTSPEPLSPEAKAQALRADEMLASHADLVAHLKEQLRWAQQEQSSQANATRHSVPQYAVNDQVWLNAKNWSTFRPSKKLDFKSQGPYTVTKVIHDGRAYRLDLPQEMISAGVFPIFHPNLLRPADAVGLPDQAPPQPLPVQINDQEGSAHDEWYVDEFVDVRKATKGRAKDTWQYQIKWAGYPKPTWEPAIAHLQAYDALLFHWKHPDKPKPPGLYMPPGWQPRSEDHGDPQDEYISGDDNTN
jgi:transposase InsO family protein